MGHKPDRRARKARGAREARKDAARKRRNDEIIRRLEEMPSVVKRQFNRCLNVLQKIQLGMIELKDGEEKELYSIGRTTLTVAQIRQMHDLLTLYGWNITVKSPLDGHGKGPRPIGLFYRHPAED